MNYRKEIDRINEIENEWKCFTSIMLLLQELEEHKDEDEIAELQYLEGIYVPHHTQYMKDKHGRKVMRYWVYDFDKLEVSDFFTEEHRKELAEKLIPLLEEFGGLWEGDYTDLEELYLEEKAE